MTSGVLYPLSLIFLCVVVCSVYTLAADVNVSSSVVVKKMFQRFARLVGLLAALAVVVYFLSLV